MRGFQNNVIFSSKVLLASFKFRKCSKTFEFCERNVDFNKTILARGLNLFPKQFSIRSRLGGSYRMLLYGQLCYWKLYVIVSGQLCYWEFCGNQIFPNSYTWDQSTIFDWEFLQRKLCKFENSSKKKDTRPEQWQPSLVLMGLRSKQNMYAHMHHVCLSGMYII